MNGTIGIIKAFWLSIRSNQTFVLVSGLFFGAVGDAIFDSIQTGHLDLSSAGIHRILASAAGTAFIAWWHLVRPSPGSNPNPNR